VAYFIMNLMPAGLLKQRYSTLNAIAEKLRTRLNNPRSSPITPQLPDLDKQIKVKYDAMKNSFTAFIRLPGTPKGEAAKLLMPVFKPYWSVMSKSYATQETKLKELRRRISSMGDYLDALTTLELMPTWLEFTALDDTFNDLYEERVKEKATAPESASSIKKEVVADYETFCNALELQLATDPTEQLALLFDEVNIVRKIYAPPHRLRLSRKHTSAELIPPQPYFGGKPITPLTRIFYKADEETVELKFTIDYEVSYKNNKDVGDAMMIIHGKGKYRGQFVITFHITR